MGKIKNRIKKVCSLLLSAVMIIGCWVCTPVVTVAEAATGGNYNIRVTFSSDSNLESNFNGNIGTEYNDSMGIVVKYKTNNGRGSEASTYFNLKGNKLSGTREATINGFPTLLYLYFDDNRAAVFGGTGTAKCTRLEVKGTGQSTWTTLWTGTLQVKSVYNPYACSVSFDGSTKTNYFGSDSDCKVSGSSGSWASSFPYASNMTASLSSSSVTCPKVSTDSAKTTTLTYGATDQYGVTMSSSNCDVSIVSNYGSSQVNGSNSITISNNHTGTDTISVPFEANVKSSTNQQTANVTCKWSGSSEKTKTVNLTVNDATYTATFKYIVGGTNNTETSKTATAQYDSPVTVPVEPEAYYNDSNHWTFSAWSPSVGALTSDKTFTAQYIEGTHGHTYTVTNFVATATSAGYVEHKCSCGDAYYDGYVAPTGTECTATSLSSDGVYFNVPEAIYLAPGGTSFQYVLDQNMGATGGITVNTGYKAISSGANIDFYYKNATGVAVRAESTDFASISLSTGTSFTMSNSALSKGSVSLISGSVNESKSGYIKWIATYTDTTDNLQKTATAFTYVYSPDLSIVGAASRSNHGDDLAYAQMLDWWQGVHGTTGSLPSTNGTNKGFETKGLSDPGPGFYYPNIDTNSHYLLPMTIGVYITASDEAVQGWLSSTPNAYGKNIQLGNYDGGLWNESVLTMVTSYIANLFVDTSRVTNLNQVPNLKVGSMIADRENSMSHTTYEIGYRINNPEYYNGSFQDGGPSSGDFYNYCRNYNVGTSIYNDADAPAGFLYNNPLDCSISAGTTRVDFVGKLAGGKNAYDAGVTLFCPLDVTGTDKSDLRQAVYAAQSIMAKYCDNNGTSSVVSGTAYASFIAAYENAYRGLTKLDDEVDVSSLRSTLESAISALNAASKQHVIVAVAATSSRTAGLRCIHCDYNTTIPANVVKDCTSGSTAVVNPTCTGNGSSTFTCSTCGYQKVTTLPALGHSYEFKGFTWNGTTSAVANFTCSRDSSHKTTASATVTNIISTPSTCNETGIRTYTATATFEGKTYSDSKTTTIAVISHTPGVAATCTEAQVCTVCGITLAPANGHVWNDGVVTTNPTCAAEGETTYTCTVCGATMKESVDINSSAHNYGGWVFDSTTKTHTRTCANDASHKETVACSFTSALTVAPTYNTDGSRVYTCSVCGGSYTETISRLSTFVKLNEQTLIAETGIPSSYAVKANNAVTEGVEYSYVGVLNSVDDINDVLSVIPVCTSSVAGSYGVLTVDSEGMATFTLNTMQFSGAEEFYLVVSVINATGYNDVVYVYEKITVIPATSVYYEDTFVSDVSSSGITYVDGVSSSGSWGRWETVTAGTPLSRQIASIVEAESELITENEADFATFSNNVIHKVQVADKNAGNANKNWPYAEFSFSGTGFDLLSLTDNTSGMFVVSVYNSQNKRIYNKVIDTYYGYSYGRVYMDDEGNPTLNVTDKPMYRLFKVSEYEGNTAVTETMTLTPTYYDAENNVSHTPSDNPAYAYGWVMMADCTDSVYQVPVIKCDCGTYGTYRVKIEARFTASFGHYNTSGNDKYFNLYLDGIRIYNPVDTSSQSNTVVTEAYATIGELNPEYTPVRDVLMTDLSSINSADRPTGAIYVSGHSVTSDADARCLEGSPKNELCLDGGNGIAFSADSSSFADIQIGMRSSHGTAVNVQIIYDNISRIISISSASEKYYSLPDVLGVDDVYGTVIIKNISSQGSILSLTNIKTTEGYKTAQYEAPMRTNAFYVNDATVKEAIELLSMVESDLSIGKDNVSFEIADDAIVLTVTTSVDVAFLEIRDADGVLVDPVSVDTSLNADDRTITRSIVLERMESGEYSFTIKGFCDNGYAGDASPLEIIIVVPERLTDEIDLPDSVEDNSSLFSKLEVVKLFKRILTAIIDYLNSLFKF